MVTCNGNKGEKMPLKRMKQKKYKGVYELLNSDGLVTGYYINYCGADGKTKKVRSNAGNPDDAKLELNTIVTSLNNDRKNNLKKNISLKLGNGTLEAIADKYFLSLLNDTTKSKCESRFKLYLGKIHAKKTITPEHVRLIQKKLQKKGLSHKTINTATDLLRSILNFGIANKHLQSGAYNMSKYKKLTEDNDMSVEAVLSPDEILEMFKIALPENANYTKRRVHFFLKMLYYTAQRPQSILALQRKDIGKELITIATIKRQGKHYVNISDKLVDDLNEWIEDLSNDDYLFGSEFDKTKSINYSTMVKTASYVFENYNIGKNFLEDRGTWISFYTLRHSAATNILSATGSIELAQDLLNHSSPKMTKKYAKLLNPDKKRAVNVL